MCNVNKERKARKHFIETSGPVREPGNVRGHLQPQRLHLPWPVYLIAPLHHRDLCISLIYICRLVQCAGLSSWAGWRQQVVASAWARSRHAYFWTFPSRGSCLEIASPVLEAPLIVFLSWRLKHEELATPPQ